MTTDRPLDVPQAPLAALTVRQKILVAAVSLGEGDFDVDALVLRAWERFPESFSLTGDEHPDSNRVLSKLSGVDGLCGLGWLTRTAPCTYRVTRDGRRVAAALPRDATTPTETPRTAVVEVAVTEAAAAATGAPPKAPRPRKAKVARAPADAAPAKPEPLAPHEVLGVNVLAKSEALRKFLRGSPLNFADACAFWGVSPKRPVDAVARAEATGTLLTRVVECLGDEGPVDPKLPSLSTCYGLLNLHRLMASRFEKELEATRSTEVGRG